MVLKKIYRKETKRMEYALVSKSEGKPLEYFGIRKPSKKRFMKAENRVQYFKNFGSFIRVGHVRKLSNGKKSIVRPHSVKRPKTIGSLWHGPGYIHGPRKIKPENCKQVLYATGKAEKTLQQRIEPSDMAKIEKFAKKNKLKIIGKPKVKVCIGEHNKVQSYATPIKEV